MFTSNNLMMHTAITRAAKRGILSAAEATIRHMEITEGRFKLVDVKRYIDARERMHGPYAQYNKLTIRQ